MRETTEAILRDLGHAVETASDGPAMLRRLGAAPAECDLIITDYAMPLMSGCEMLKQAREILPDIPAIIISGYADSRSIARPAGVAVAEQAVHARPDEGGDRRRQRVARADDERLQRAAPDDPES